jgi:hypothetical protein
MQCGGPSDECQRHIKYLHCAVLETVLFFDADLHKHLFMHKELKPRTTNKETIAAAHKTSIKHLVLYRLAFSDVYPDLATQVYALDTSPPAVSPGSQSSPSCKHVDNEDSPQQVSSSKHACTSTATLLPTQQIPIFIVLWTQVCVFFKFHLYLYLICYSGASQS